MEKVSIIIPVYNVENYLSRCLESVINQTYRELEIICVNDGSRDSSREILGKFASRDSRFKIIDQENRGQAEARNAALDVATGDWIMFVDSDDWIPRDSVASFIKVATESGARVIASSRYARDDFRDKPNRKIHWKLREGGLKYLVGKRQMQSCVWNKFYRADQLKTRRFIAGIYFEDWPFITELFGDIVAFAEIREPLYVYCKNVGGSSTIKSPFNEKKAESYRVGIAHVKAYFENHPLKYRAMKRVAIAEKMLAKRLKKM